MPTWLAVTILFIYLAVAAKLVAWLGRRKEQSNGENL